MDQTSKNIALHPYPFFAQAGVCICLDDLHPESASNDEQLDFGTHPTVPPLSHIQRALEEFPFLKFTLFAVPNWIDRSDWPSGSLFFLRPLFRRRREYRSATFLISKPQYRAWAKRISKFYPHNIELALHGFFHHNSQLQYYPSQELAGLSPQKFQHRVQKAKMLFRHSGLSLGTGFRPPGWYINEEQVEVLRSEGLTYFSALSSVNDPAPNSRTDTKKFPYFSQNASTVFPEIISGLWHFTANCFPTQTDKAIALAKLQGFISFHAHLAKTAFGLITIDKYFSANMERFLQEHRFQTGRALWHATYQEAAQYLDVTQKIKVTEKERGLFAVENTSSQAAKEVTVLIHSVPYILSLKGNEKKVLNLLTVAAPQVSVVLTTFNGEKTIQDSLRSLVQQTFAKAEVIVVDDGSTDGTAALIKKTQKEFPYSKITYHFQKNKGRAAAKNAGLALAQGKFVAFCEDDAWYSPHYLESLLPHFSHRNVMGIIGPHYVWNRESSFVTRSKELERRRNFAHYKPKTCWIYRTADLKRVHGFDESLEFGEDVEPIKRIRPLYQAGEIHFEPQAVWLHNEPATIMAFLRRKYLGGIGLATLAHAHHGLPPTLFPCLFGLILIGTAILGSLLFLPAIYIAYSLLLVGLAVLVFLTPRIRDYRQLSLEPLWFCVFASILQNVGIGATFLGFMQGYIMNPRFSLLFLQKYGR